jgi:hypothetical protein
VTSFEKLGVQLEEQNNLARVSYFRSDKQLSAIICLSNRQVNTGCVVIVTATSTNPGINSFSLFDDIMFWCGLCERMVGVYKWISGRGCYNTVYRET